MSDYTPTTDEIVEAVVYHQTRKGFGGMGTVGRDVAVSRVNNWLALERAKVLREAADAFEGATINVAIFGDSPEAKWWEAANAARDSLIASLRDRADKLEGK